MAALHTAPDSAAAQLERAEDSSECDPDQEEEEEERGEEIEEEEEMGGEDGEDEPDADGVQARQVEAVLQEDEDMEVLLADAQSPELGAQEHLRRSGNAKSPVLQEKALQASQVPAMPGEEDLEDEDEEEEEDFLTAGSQVSCPISSPGRASSECLSPAVLETPVSRAAARPWGWGFVVP